MAKNVCIIMTKQLSFLGRNMQEQYESIDLSKSEWEQVISKAETSDASEFHMFVLRCLANQQVVTNGSINAFQRNVIKNSKDRTVSSSEIGLISRWVREVTGNPRATFYSWNSIKAEWSIGYFQTRTLRQALGSSALPESN